MQRANGVERLGEGFSGRGARGVPGKVNGG